MKVTLSFACNLDDVTQEVGDLIQNIINNKLQPIEAMLDSVVEECIQGNAGRSLEEIDQCRKYLANLDERLMDYAMILGGYIKAHADEHVGLPEQFPQQTQEVSPMDILSEEHSNVNIEETTEETND